MTNKITVLGQPYEEKKENDNIKIEEMGIEITQKALMEYKKAALSEGNLFIRIGVKGGGCSGFLYINEFINEQDIDNEDDITEYNEETGIVFVMDIFSKEYLKGTTIDYLNSLTESGFKFISPNVSRSCGCGKSFSVWTNR